MFDVSKPQLLQYWETWPKISSPCFWKGLFVLVNLLFISIFFLQFLLKIFSTSFRRKSKTPEEAKHINGDIRLGISYTVSKWCCSLILGTCLIGLVLFLLQRYTSHCNSILSVASEIIQVASWLVMLVPIFCFQKAKSSKLPFVIRIWWISNFLEAVTCIAFKVDFILHHKEIIRVEECPALIRLLGCTYLLVMSIRGNTGIGFTNNSITEPLLHTSTDKQTEGKRQSPYGRASLVQLVTFSWLNPLLAIGVKKPLEQAEVPDVDIKDSAEFLSQSFDNHLNYVKERYGSQDSSIYRTIFLFIWKKAAINACFAVATASASYVGPSLINDCVKFLSGQRKHGLRGGYLLALAFLSANFVETVTRKQWIFGARQLTLRLRAALISQVYKKGLHLSNQSRQNHTSGEIINYMSVDIQRIADVMYHANIIWMLPIQITLAIYILHKNLGLGALAGLATTFVIMAFNVPLTRAQKRIQSKIMETKDERMKATSEVLRSMKILKLQAWDTMYLHKLESLRNIEYNWLWKSLRLQAISSFIFWGAPAFISVMTFGACMLMGIPLTAGRVLSALSTFRMLQDPIFSLPDLLSVLAQGKVSADRVASHLQEDEIKSCEIEVVPRNETDFDIEIDHGVFSWNPDAQSPTLKDVQLTVRRGMKVAICGTVGSGKSSLLSSILGEIPKLTGTVKVSGSKAYVSQSPWILTGNIQENILFGSPYDNEKYEKTIQACALIKDFELFASGDLTEIGERGINMSGGQKQRIQLARAIYQDTDVYLLDDPFSAVDAHTGTQLFKDCLMGILKEKTVLYVTHQVEFLPAADLILQQESWLAYQEFKELRYSIILQNHLLELQQSELLDRKNASPVQTSV